MAGVFICISLVTNDVKNLFLCLLNQYLLKEWMNKMCGWKRKHIWPCLALLKTYQWLPMALRAELKPLPWPTRSCKFWPLLMPLAPDGSLLLLLWIPATQTVFQFFWGPALSCFCFLQPGTQSRPDTRLITCISSQISMLPEAFLDLHCQQARTLIGSLPLFFLPLPQL